MARESEEIVVFARRAGVWNRRHGFVHLRCPQYNFDYFKQPQMEHQTTPYDIIVIGAGPGGLSTAIEASKAGLRWIALRGRRQ